MDKDLKDAVLAAFDGKAEDETQAPDDATAAEPAAASGSPPKAGSASRKPPLSAAAGSARRLTAPAAPATRGAVAHGSAAVPLLAFGAVLSLLLTLALVVMVAILLAQTLSLKAAVSRQEAELKDLRRLARITVSVYQEPGKRPQQVIAGHDVDAEGKAKIDKMIIRPLPED